MKPKENYISGADLFGSWRDDLLTGKAPTLYQVGTGDLGRIEIGPGLVTLIGGAPGSGKTAFTMQCVVDALRMTPTLRAVVCNIEMPAGVLLDRQIARLAGIDARLIRYRKLGEEHADRLDQALNTLEPLADRLAFVRPPFDLANVAATADDFGGALIVLDYIQRISPPGDHNDKRHSVDATMNYLRQFADAGVAVVVVSAVGRGKDRHGRSSYADDAIGLASFRESSELEFGCDDAYILAPGKKDEPLILRHLKSRNGETRDISLWFDKATQRFDPADADDLAEPKDRPGDKGKLTKSLRLLWATPADAGGGDDDE